MFAGAGGSKAFLLERRQMTIDDEEKLQAAMLRDPRFAFTPLEASLDGQRVVIMALMEQQPSGRIDLTPVAILVPDEWIDKLKLLEGPVKEKPLIVKPGDDA